MNKHFGTIAFALGLAAVAWVALGYLGVNWPALSMTLLIAAFYLIGALELWRYRQATERLQAAISHLATQAEPPAQMHGWLATLPADLQNPVRQRIAGERVALPGPALAPYLVGLLVLLGMLGTFLGMVVTLNGTVMALQSTTDLGSMRAALAAPVKGLGLAFGTSVAGVAASAMLGLMSALFRRERLAAAQRLESLVAGPLRRFSRAHQREATLDSLQAQARLLPDLVHSVQTLSSQLAAQNAGLQQRLVDGQDQFHRQALAGYTELAASVEQSLQRSLSDGARAAGAALQQAAEATMGGITRDTAAFQRQMTEAAQQQLHSLTLRLDGMATTVTEGWAVAMAQQQRGHEAQASGLQHRLAELTQGFEQGTAKLLDAVDQRQAEGQRLQQASAATLAQRAEQQSAALLAALAQAQQAQRDAAVAADQHRLAAWTESLQAMAVSLRSDWQQAGKLALAQQEQICHTLAQTAGDLQDQARAQTRDTLDQMARLTDTASKAPRAAAELVGQLREQLSASLAHDNGLLEERGRIMAALGKLLDTVNQSAHAQRDAIAALVDSSATMLAQTGARFDDRLESGAASMADAAAQLGAGAVEVASLGEVFGAAVQRFDDASETLVDQLQRVAGALSQSSTRSDEQLAYYVAQAREIVDLSISSQRQIVEDLQQLAVRRQPLAGAVAGAVA